MGNRVFKVIVIVLGLYLLWVSVAGLWDLRKAGGRLGGAREELAKAKEENQQLRLKLEEVSSDEFVEKEAREKLNLQKPGEVVVVFDNSQISDVRSQMSDTPEKKIQNWEKWWRLFFGN